MGAGCLNEKEETVCYGEERGCFGVTDSENEVLSDLIDCPFQCAFKSRLPLGFRRGFSLCVLV